MQPRFNNLTVRLIVPILCLAAAICIASPQTPAKPDQIEFFEKSIRPILAARCYSCHGSTKQFAGFRLDSRASLLKGGEKGPGIVPGEPDKSRLIEAIRQSGTLKMPPDGKLNDKEITGLTDWVKTGAPWPTKVKTSERTFAQRMAEDRTKLWSLKPVRTPHLPPIKNLSWPVNSIDHFVLAELERKDLRPARTASRETLLRRATYDLIGLPPSPEDISRFLADRSPNAWDKVIERLLASPHYGERWGRQWLDLARYSDTRGYLVGPNGRGYPFAYTYRDYVIRSLNEDKPYDRFIMEQIAADQLALSDKRDLAALGFITVGNRFLDDLQEIIDDRIDVVCRGLQGMTSGCARCHDHKFDPIPTEDYYSLYAVFNGSHEPGDLPVIGEPANKLAFEEYKTKSAAIELRLAEAKKKAKNTDEINKIQKELTDLIYTHAGSPPRAMVVADNATQGKQKVYLRGNAGTPGAEVPRRFLLAVAGDSRKSFEKGSGRLDLAKSIVNPANPLTARVMMNRIWLGHFGRALVRTPSDFGTRGEPPDNPALLDWLAFKFMDPSNGSAWSLKKMHRLIMLSNTYKQSSDGDPRTVKADPDNRMFGRMNRRRLDFEQIRDSLLAVSGSLDPMLYGRPDDSLEKSRRRTIYEFIDRQALPGLFRVFDFPDPNQHGPQRTSTTVPQQSLFLLNNGFVQDMAKALAARIAEPNAELRAAKMAGTAWGRTASIAEGTFGVAFVRKVESLPANSPASISSTWQNGYGDYDLTAHKLISFTPLAKFTGTQWQGGENFPDGALGYCLLAANGGHPGDKKHAVIRRWTSPADLVVTISGQVDHPSPNGDGVVAIVYHSQKGELKSVVAAHGSAQLRLDRVSVKKGDFIDFILHCRENETSDSFAWAPNIDQNDGVLQWNAATDFSGPLEKPKPPNAWEVYAHALFMANAFLYVD